MGDENGNNNNNNNNNGGGGAFQFEVGATQPLALWLGGFMTFVCIFGILFIFWRNGRRYHAVVRQKHAIPGTAAAAGGADGGADGIMKTTNNNDSDDPTTDVVVNKNVTTTKKTTPTTVDVSDAASTGKSITGPPQVSQLAGEPSASSYYYQKYEDTYEHEEENFISFLIVDRRNRGALWTIPMGLLLIVIVLVCMLKHTPSFMIDEHNYYDRGTTRDAIIKDGIVMGVIAISSIILLSASTKCSNVRMTVLQTALLFPLVFGLGGSVVAFQMGIRAKRIASQFVVANIDVESSLQMKSSSSSSAEILYKLKYDTSRGIICHYSLSMDCSYYYYNFGAALIENADNYYFADDDLVNHHFDANNNLSDEMMRRMDPHWILSSVDANLVCGSSGAGRHYNDDHVYFDDDMAPQQRYYDDVVDQYYYNGGGGNGDDNVDVYDHTQDKAYNVLIDPDGCYVEWYTANNAGRNWTNEHHAIRYAALASVAPLLLFVIFAALFRCYRRVSEEVEYIEKRCDEHWMNIEKEREMIEGSSFEEEYEYYEDEERTFSEDGSYEPNKDEPRTKSSTNTTKDGTAAAANTNTSSSPSLPMPAFLQSTQSYKPPSIEVVELQ